MQGAAEMSDEGSVNHAKTSEKMARILFVDDGDIAAMQGVERVIHPGEKHEANPVLVPDQPWEERMLYGCTVRKEEDLYRMWYQGHVDRTILNLYAESADGIHWEKPILRQYEDFDGSVENNIFLSRLAFRSGQRSPFPHAQQDHNPNVLYTPHMGEDRTYTLISYDYGRSGYAPYDGYYLAFSRDGLHWTDGPEEAVIPGHADVGWFIFDEQDRIFRGIVKMSLNIRAIPRRSILWTESTDGFNWAMPQPALIPEPQEDHWRDDDRQHLIQFYGMPIFRYESMLLGFLQFFKVTDPANRATDGAIEGQLACSRDGRHWQRVGDRRAIIERGEEGAWDWGSVKMCNSLVADGEIVRAYYEGWDTTHGADLKSMHASIGMITWPRDRFVGLRAGPAGGEVKVASVAHGRELHVNANASSGSLVAEIVTAAGEPVEGFEAPDCVPLSEDSLDTVIRWRGSPSFAPLAGNPVGVNIKMTEAEVFSIWWT